MRHGSGKETSLASSCATQRPGLNDTPHTDSPA
jgi:hypothetical protein